MSISTMLVKDPKQNFENILLPYHEYECKVKDLKFNYCYLTYSSTIDWNIKLIKLVGYNYNTDEYIIETQGFDYIDYSTNYSLDSVVNWVKQSVDENSKIILFDIDSMYQHIIDLMSEFKNNNYELFNKNNKYIPQVLSENLNVLDKLKIYFNKHYHFYSLADLEKYTLYQGNIDFNTIKNYSEINKLLNNLVDINLLITNRDKEYVEGYLFTDNSYDNPTLIVLVKLKRDTIFNIKQSFSQQQSKNILQLKLLPKNVINKFDDNAGTLKMITNQLPIELEESPTPQSIIYKISINNELNPDIEHKLVNQFGDFLYNYATEEDLKHINKISTEVLLTFVEIIDQIDHTNRFHVLNLITHTEIQRSNYNSDNQSNLNFLNQSEKLGAAQVSELSTDKVYEILTEGTKFKSLIDNYLHSLEGTIYMKKLSIDIGTENVDDKIKIQLFTDFNKISKSVILNLDPNVSVFYYRKFTGFYQSDLPVINPKSTNYIELYFDNGEIKELYNNSNSNWTKTKQYDSLTETKGETSNIKSQSDHREFDRPPNKDQLSAEDQQFYPPNDNQKTTQTEDNKSDFQDISNLLSNKFTNFDFSNLTYLPENISHEICNVLYRKYHDDSVDIEDEIKKLIIKLNKTYNSSKDTLNFLKSLSSKNWYDSTTQYNNNDESFFTRSHLNMIYQAINYCDEGGMLTYDQSNRFEKIKIVLDIIEDEKQFKSIDSIKININKIDQMLSQQSMILMYGTIIRYTYYLLNQTSTADILDNNMQTKFSYWITQACQQLIKNIEDEYQQYIKYIKNHNVPLDQLTITKNVLLEFIIKIKNEFYINLDDTSNESLYDETKSWQYFNNSTENSINIKFQQPELDSTTFSFLCDWYDAINKEDIKNEDIQFFKNHQLFTKLLDKGIISNIDSSRLIENNIEYIGNCLDKNTIRDLLNLIQSLTEADESFKIVPSVARIYELWNQLSEEFSLALKNKSFNDQDKISHFKILFRDILNDIIAFVSKTKNN